MMEVTEEHPDVQAIVEEALKEAEQVVTPPSLDLYAEVLENHIREVCLKSSQVNYLED